MFLPQEKLISGDGKVLKQFEKAVLRASEEGTHSKIKMEEMNMIVEYWSNASYYNLKWKIQK